jgi:predicted phage terminase large subunit-like protein
MTKKTLHRLLLHNDLPAFIEQSFYTLNPGAKYLIGGHIYAMAYALERVARGEIKRLIITVPPRHLKSHSISVAFVAWLMGLDPTRRIIAASYAMDLAQDFSLQTRKVMEAPWYREVFPGTTLDPKKTTLQELRTTKNGYRLATSAGGTLTGKGGDLIIIDDPMKAADAHSEIARKNVIDWFTTTVLSRLNDPKNDAIIVVAQRLHAEDLPGYLLDQGGWVHLNLPAIAVADQSVPITNEKDWGRQKGTALQPNRLDLKELAQLKNELGSGTFETQYQQNPSPPEGNFVKLAWFDRYATPKPLDQYDMIIQSWDTAIEVGEQNDYSACVTCGLHADGIDILHVYRQRLAYPELRKAVIGLKEKFKAEIVIVEKAGSGASLYQDLRCQGLGWIYLMSPTVDKISRLAQQSAKIEMGLIALPKSAPWLEAFEGETAAFPNGKYDDQVDALSQLLKALDCRTSPLYGLSIYQSPKWLWAAAKEA